MIFVTDEYLDRMRKVIDQVVSDMCRKAGLPILSLSFDLVLSVAFPK